MTLHKNPADVLVKKVFSHFFKRKGRKGFAKCAKKKNLRFSPEFCDLCG